MSQSDFVTRGQALVASGQYQEAVKVCRLGLLGRPTTVEGRIVLGQALLALKRFDEVLAEMRVALELDHSAVGAHALKAEALLKKGDARGALEVLAEARALSPHDARVAELTAEAGHGDRLGVAYAPTAAAAPAYAPYAPPQPYVAPPAVGFVGAGDVLDADASEGFTKPQLTAAMPARRGAGDVAPPAGKPKRKDPTPPAAILAVGDKSGTVEVDPDVDGVAVDDDRDFDDVAAPPAASAAQIAAAKRPSTVGAKPNNKRGTVPAPAPAAMAMQPAKARSAVAPAAPPAQAQVPRSAPMIDITDDSDVIELDETGSRRLSAVAAAARRSHAQVRANVNAQVKMPSGPIDIDEEEIAQARAKSKTAPPPMGVAGLAGLAGLPPPSTPVASTLPSTPAYVMPPMPGMPMQQMAPMTGMPHPHGQGQGLGIPPAAPLPPAPRVPLAAALPTVAAMPVQAPHAPMPPPPPSPQQLANAQRKTLAIHAPPATAVANPALVAVGPIPPLAAAVAPIPPLVQPPPHLHVGPIPPMQAQMYAVEPPPAESWSVAAASEPTISPVPDYGAREPADSRASTPAIDSVMLPNSPSRTSLRRPRSKLTIALWVVVGAAVIGGGVFAGFQIRAMRLQKQIAAAREHAVDMAKADTYGGWLAAQTSLAGIAEASNTFANRAALARTRALIAYEFGDGVPEAKALVDSLGTSGGVDGNVAAAYLALAQSDAKAARLAADQAVSDAPADAGAIYVAGQAKLLAGELRDAVKQAKDAVDKDPRPLYALGLARAQAALYQWDDALGSVKRAFSTAADQPAAIIAQALILADAGRIAAAPGAQNSDDARTQLLKVIDEGKKPPADQPRGISQTQLAFAELALARVDFARGDATAAVADINAAAGLKIDDQRFAELAVETLLEIGETAIGEQAAQTAVDDYPTSKRAKLALARIELAQGKTADALALLAKAPEVTAQPLGLAVRGQAKLAQGDVDGARADFDAALQKQANLEPAIVGDAMLALRTGDVEEARRLVEPRVNDKGTPPAIAIAYAAVLRRGDDAAKTKARAMLESLAAGAAGAETPRAQLELARAYKDAGDYAAARKEYAAAGQAGNADARLEGAVLAIDDRDPAVGRDALDALLKAAGDTPTAELVLETARARMLVGDQQGAAQLLETADKLPNVARWQLQRERGRLYMRRGDLAAAVNALGNALEGCGGDADTFLLATDAATMNGKSGLADKVRKLLPERLKGRPEAQIVSGKLFLDGGKNADAKIAYHDAKDALQTQKGLPRLIAQADYGLAVVAYNDSLDVDAQNELKYVLFNDPTLYDAYLFEADILKDPKAGLEQARIAVRYNADYPRAWSLLGRLAAKVGDKPTLADAVEQLGKLAPTSPEYQELVKLKAKLGK